MAAVVQLGGSWGATSESTRLPVLMYTHEIDKENPSSVVDQHAPPPSGGVAWLCLCRLRVRTDTTMATPHGSFTQRDQLNRTLAHCCLAEHLRTIQQASTCCALLNNCARRQYVRLFDSAHLQHNVVRLDVSV